MSTVMPHEETAGLPRTRRVADPVLLAALGFLLVLGTIAIFSASTGSTVRWSMDQTAFLRRHLLWLLIGGAAAALMASVPARFWKQNSVVLFAGTIGLLVVLLAVGDRVYGSSRWLFGGSVQPSEIAKLTVIIYMADWLSERKVELRRWAQGIVPFSILTGIVCGLIVLQRDYSTTVLLILVVSAMFFVAGARLDQMVVAGSVAGLIMLGFLFSEQYRMERVQAFFHPHELRYGAGYQPLLAAGAFTDGGLFGTGLGSSQAKHTFPSGTAHTDAIFAVIGEETGAVGCWLLILLFGIIAWRGLRTAIASRDRFCALLATGVTVWLVTQALVHGAVVTRMMPFTGIPMPFVSFGGSSLVACLAGVGLLLNVSRSIDPSRARIYAPLDLGRRNRRSRVSRRGRARRLGRAG